MGAKRILAILGATAVVLFVTASSASAHITGASWEVPVGKYTVDVGYDPTTFTQGQYERFDFNLWVGQTTTDQNGITSGTPQDFAQVWIRIIRASDQDTLLATGIWKQPIGPTTLLFEFDEPGNYSVEVSFRDAQGNDIAVTTIPVLVAPSGTSDLQIEALALVAGFVAGAACAWFGYRYFARRKRR